MTIVVDRKRRRKMDGSASFINSKATAITSILLTAWRRKLSNEEWEARIRKVIPRGVNGDVYDLAKCIIDQALIGPVPNSLFISYLKHAINCELVSHGNVLAAIYDQFTNNSQCAGKTLSVNCLLNLIDEFKDKIMCKGNEVECVNLCRSLGLVIHLLFKFIKTSITSISNSLATLIQQAPSINQLSSSSSNNPTTTVSNTSNLLSSPLYDYVKIICLSTNLIEYFTMKPFYKSLLFIGKIEFGKEFDELSATIDSVNKIISQNLQLRNYLKDSIRSSAINKLLDKSLDAPDVHPTIVAARQLKCILMNRPRPTCTTLSFIEKQVELEKLLRYHDSTTSQALFDLLYSLVAFEVVLRPARPVKLLAQQISTITNFISAPLHDTYCELLRVCMIGSVDANHKSEQVKWVNFTFLKLPKLFNELNKTESNFYADDISILQNSHSLDSNNCIQSVNNNQFLEDLKLALRRLCEYSSFLDEAEQKCDCDFFICFIKELIKLDPSLAPLKSLSDLRTSAARKQTSCTETSSMQKTYLGAELVVTSMLKALDSQQNPVDLFAFLSQLVSHKTFEIALSAAASTGQLQTFIKRLVEHNEANKMSTPQITNETTATNKKFEPIRALIFDITFLMLTYIAHYYGSDVIDCQERQTSTFIKWYYDCYNSETRVNCPLQMLRNCDTNLINDLIEQLLKPTVESEAFSTSSISLNKFSNVADLFLNIPAALNEIFNAWQQGLLNDSHIKTVIERIKSKMCSLAVVTACWLQCYIRTLDDDERVKPLQFLLALTKSSLLAKRHPQFESESGHQSTVAIGSERYVERSSLMCSITRKIYFELCPATSSTNSIPQQQQALQSSANTSTAVSTLASLAAAKSSSNNSSFTSSSALTTSSSSTSTRGTDSSADDSQQNETSHQSVNGRFISTLWSHEILKDNVKQCLRRGWIDTKALHSLNSVFKLVGANNFTSFLVHHVMSSLESPSDLNRAINISFSLFHLDIEACAIALLRNIIPMYMLQDKKQEYLSQPRALALAQLCIMSIFGAMNQLKSRIVQSNDYQQRQLQQQDDVKPVLNGFVVKMEVDNAILTGNNNGSLDSSGGPRPAKRIKAEPNTESTSTPIALNAAAKLDIAKRLHELDDCITSAMQVLGKIVADSTVSQRTLFPLLFLQQAVVCARKNSECVTKFLQPETLLDIISLFSSELSFELALSISNMHSSRSRRVTARAMCQLASIKELTAKQIPLYQASLGSKSSDLQAPSPQRQLQQQQQLHSQDGNRRPPIDYLSSNTVGSSGPNGPTPSSGTLVNP